MHSLYQHEPLHSFFPGIGAGEVAQAILINTTGGIAGGDHLNIDIVMGEQAHAHVTTQAAEKIYRSLGAESRITTQLTLASGSWLEWMPQETIFFNQARLRRQNDIYTMCGSQLMAGEILIWGRIAHAERVSHGLLHDLRSIYRENRLIWVDALHMQDDLASILQNPAAFNNAVAYAVFFYVGDDASQYLATARDLLSKLDVSAAATCVCAEVLVVRFLSDNAMRLRANYVWFWHNFRATISPRLKSSELIVWN